MLVKGNVPSKLKKIFDNNWRPILELMHGYVREAVRDTAVEDRNNRFIRWTYEHALKKVGEEYPEFTDKMGGGLMVGTCCKMIRAENAKRRKLQVVGWPFSFSCY